MLIENCLPQDLFNSLVTQVTNWSNVPWFFAQNTALNPEDNITVKPFYGSWAHNSILYGNDNSSLAPICRKVIDHILSTSGQKLHFLSRCRFGLITTTPYEIVHDAHVDFIDFKHKTGLLYLNDSDGDTILYNKFHKEGDEYPIKCSEQDISLRVSAKANRVYIFDGYQYHSSTAPMKNIYRLVMNFNYQTK